MKLKTINKKDIGMLFEELKKDRRMYGLVNEYDRFLFKEVETLSDPGADYKHTVLPPKKYFLPQIETLIRYQKDGWKENEAVAAKEKFVVWGARPCDIHAINLLDKIFEADNADSQYLNRRKNGMVVGVTCQAPCDDKCFCYDIGTLDVDSGYDFLLTDTGATFVVAVGTDAAEKIAKKLGMKDAAAEETKKLDEMKKNREKVFTKKLKTEVNLLPLLFKGGDANPLWEELGKKCLACGSCNLVCPTCYCFDVLDKNEVNLQGGERVRRWDGCMLKDFTLVAGNEVFRKTKAGRLKHRWHRKFDYLMTKWGQSNCVGCGRCGRACLVDINPIDIVNGLSAKN
jgi:ferredoxin